MNNQKPIRKYKKNGDFLYVHSIFNTIQGEGIYAGRPAVFLRLFGCNLQCPSCDTDYTSKKLLLSKDCIVDQIKLESGGSTLVVITGGEPMNQKIGDLIATLYEEGYTIQVETNGTIYREDIDYGKCIICCSPKTHVVDERLLTHINFFKYVIGEGDLCERGLPKNVLGLKGKEVYKPLEGNIYVQPMDSGCDEKNKVFLSKAISSCMEHNYTLGVQMHKIIGVD